MQGARILRLPGPALVDRIIALLPRSIERGPVEANKTSVRLSGAPSFRAQLSAAPLKRPGVPLWSPLVGAFRAQLTAAPLKRLRQTNRHTGNRQAFRAQLSAAPLKPFRLGSQ